ncbi:hypothetical protein [Pseudomonas mosselii]|uniref:GNAT family N-acetyltransferase n=1 Tax=Pseudomonas mosselii TaxID=78327 RepID=A0ABX9B0K8_9PSED|nr:hypothetical protein [Pseudomonas mosselii]QZP26312.1 hypothetical protein K5H97_26610 [Pseudomonas mosselii]
MKGFDGISICILEPKDSERALAAIRARRFSELLSPYLYQRFGEQPRRCHYVDGNVLNFYAEAYELYLKVTPPSGGFWGEETLVVARFGFKDRRKGHGTDFIRFLLSFAKDIGYTKIGLECTNQFSDAFGRKLGFQQYGEYNNLLGCVAAVSRELNFGCESPSV